MRSIYLFHLFKISMDKLGHGKILIKVYLIKNIVIQVLIKLALEL